MRVDVVTLAIGDIHGCFARLQQLVHHCAAVLGSARQRFIFIGDYIDRGPDSAGVVDFLMSQQEEHGDRFLCLRGNHEDMLLRAAAPDRSDGDLMNWWSNGGEQTLESYVADDPSDLPPAHLAWMRGLPLWTQDRHRLFVHAGIRPGVPLTSQSEHDLLWIREPFLASNDDHGALVVHGHTPTRQRKPELRSNRLNIDTGACFGGPLTAVAFADRERLPQFCITDAGVVSKPGV